MRVVGTHGVLTGTHGALTGAEDPAYPGARASRERANACAGACVGVRVCLVAWVRLCLCALWCVRADCVNQMAFYHLAWYSQAGKGGNGRLYVLTALGGYSRATNVWVLTGYSSTYGVGTQRYS